MISKKLNYCDISPILKNQNTDDAPFFNGASDIECLMRPPSRYKRQNENAPSEFRSMCQSDDRQSEPSGNSSITTAEVQPPKNETQTAHGENNLKSSQISMEVADTSLGLKAIADTLIASSRLLCIEDELFHFNGEFYVRINSKNFLAFLQHFSPDALQRKIPSIRKVDDAYKWLVSSPDICHYSAEEVYNIVRYLIPFQNGIYDAEKDEFMDFFPDLPVFYQLDAEYYPAPPQSPTWNSFLCTSFEDQADKQRLLEMIGYILMPSNDAKAFFVLGTAPDCGKSQLANFLSMVLPRDLISHVGFHDLKNRFYPERVAGRLINISMDMKSGPLTAESVAAIKLQTGEKWLEVEAKYETPRTMFSTCKFIFGSNHPIKIPGADPAFWNRLILIPFLHACPDQKKDYNLCHSLYTERDAILSKAAQAAHQLIDHHFVFTFSALANSLISEWSYYVDEIDQFIATYCEITGEKEDYVPTQQLFTAFQQSANFTSMTVQYFSKTVRARYSPALQGNTNKKRIGEKTVNVIFGIRLKKR